MPAKRPIDPVLETPGSRVVVHKHWKPEGLIPGVLSDPWAEELGEEFVRTVTSGDQVSEAVRDEPVPEEWGGPFVETDADTEFAYDVDASNPTGTKPAPFPMT